MVLQGKGAKELRKVTIFQNVLSMLVPDSKENYDEIPELLLSLPEVSIGIKNDIVTWAKASDALAVTIISPLTITNHNICP